MRSIKQYLFVTLGFGLAGAIGAAFGTGTAQAVVASLVEVVNPSTSPVPTSSVNATDPGRIAYQSTINLSGNCSGNVCFFYFPSVPAGHRVVIQHIGGAIDFDAVATSSRFLITSAGSTISAFFTPTEEQSFTIIDQPLLIYVDSSLSVAVEAVVVGAAFSTGGQQILTLTGYELDCTVAACAPIATQ